MPIFDQSKSIILGHGFEKVLRKAATVCNSSLKDITPPSNTKGKKQIDHLFIDCTKKPPAIYCAEIKCNMVLKADQRKNLRDRVKDIKQKLQLKYPTATITSVVVTPRFLYKKQMVHFPYISTYYSDIEVLGLNDYFELLKLTHTVGGKYIPLILTETQHVALLHEITASLFDIDHDLKKRSNDTVKKT